MNRPKHHVSLKTVYYRSFLCLIVVPILLIFLASLGIARVMMQRTAIANVQNAQAGIRTSLTDSVRETSLQLSHLAFVNNNAVLSLAGRMGEVEMGERYSYISQLDELFRVSAAPSQKIVSVMFFLKDGTSMYLKDAVRLTREELGQESWYQEALEQKDTVSVAVFDTSRQSLTYSRLKNGECVLGVALSPGNLTDRSGQVEMMMLFSVTPVGELVRKYNRDPMLGTTFLTDENGNLVFAGEFHGQADSFLEHLSQEELQQAVNGQGLRKRMPDPQKGNMESYAVIAADSGQHGWKIVTCVPVGKLTESYNRLASILVLVVGILMFLFYLFSRFFLHSIIVPLQSMVEGLQRVESGDLDTHIEPAGHREIRTMIHSFNRMVRQMKASIRENQQIQQKKHEAEVQALQSQINPHFLVNTLNSIRFMAQVSRFEGIRKMAEALIQILSCSFRSNISFYTVGEELNMLDSYLYLMKIRYSDGFETEYQIEESCRSYQVPRLILQPVVENSIVHGLAEKADDIGHLTVSVCEEPKHICFTVRDDGVGMDEETLNRLLEPQDGQRKDSKNIGVSNVYARLKLYFGEECSLTIKSSPGEGTETVIRIPKIEGEAENEQGIDRR